MEYIYKGTPFSIKTTTVSNGQGFVSSNLVEVFYDKVKIGEYTRNYSCFAKETFYPFNIDDCWYALYSKDYTATRVAKLTETELIDWCGEEESAMGFCPTEFYVPRYKTFESLNDNPSIAIKEFDNEYNNNPKEYHELSEKIYARYVGEYYCDYGFLSGCYWGDDSSWKLRFIDLSEIHNKVLKIDERFGYFELPYDRSLAQCVRNFEKDSFTLSQLRFYNLKKNKFSDHWVESDNS